MYNSNNKQARYQRALRDIILHLGKLDYTMIITATILMLYGALGLYSASGGVFNLWSLKHIAAYCALLLILIAISFISMSMIFSYSYILYGIAAFMLILVNIIGHASHGAKRWLNLGFAGVQPGELMKIAIILCLARYLHLRPIDWKSNTHMRNIKSLIVPFLIIFLPALLVIKQPDLGTGIIIILIGGIIIFAYGIPRKYVLVAFAAVLCAGPLIWPRLHAYQKNRIITFLYPENDPLGSGYNIIQSKIAIGSGGLLGKGLQRSTQGSLKFLPEYHTDFMFSFLMEELGFIHGLIILGLYCYLIAYLLYLAAKSKTVFNQLIIVGTSAFIFTHVFVNIGMVMGLLPVVGVPLPLVSYGRTILTSVMIMISLCMNARRGSKVISEF